MQNDPRKPVEKEKEKEKEKDKEPADHNWADDQKEHGYYYDDAHGYEPFDPESDEETEEYEDAIEDTDD